MKVITFSRHFPKTHPRAGEPTYFVEGIWKSLDKLKLTGDSLDSCINEYHKRFGELNPYYDTTSKYHTIRAGNRWKEGDWFQPRIWIGKPYASKQMDFAPPIQIKKIQTFELTPTGNLCSVYIDSSIRKFDILDEVAKHDGLSRDDFNHWFSTKTIRDRGFKGQIICWADHINY